MTRGPLDRRRSARFGAYLVSVVQTGPVKMRVPGDNFGHPWRAVRLVVVLEGELSLRTSGTIEVLGRRAAALAVGWRPLEIETSGALVLEVDVVHGYGTCPADVLPIVAGHCRELAGRATRSDSVRLGQLSISSGSGASTQAAKPLPLKYRVLSL